jgi:aryl-alcohol dehydrogenase
MAAVHLEVETAIAVDPVPGRRELALALGATHALDPTDGDAVAAIQELTHGGADAAFDTTGIPPVIADATRALGRLGTLALVGTGEALATLDVKDVIRSGKSIRGVMEGDADPLRFVPELLELVRRGRLPIDKMIVKYPFEDINQAIADTKSGATIKPVLVF